MKERVAERRLRDYIPTIQTVAVGFGLIGLCAILAAVPLIFAVNPLATTYGRPVSGSTSCIIALWPRKQCVGPAHQPVGDEANPLLRGKVEIVKGHGPSSVRGEEIR
jgi:hypothetical protein